MTKRKKLFFRSSDKEKMMSSSLVRRDGDEQWKGLIELERRCQTLREEVEHLSEKQEVLGRSDGEPEGLAESRTRKKYQEKIFKEFKKLEGKRQKKLWRSNKRSTSRLP